MNTRLLIGSGKQVPPLKDHVFIYFIEKGASEKLADGFFQHYTDLQWKTNRLKPLSNWKVAAWEWILKYHVLQ